MITHFLQISINDIVMLLCENMPLTQNMDKFLLSYKEFYYKATAIKKYLH